MGNKLFGQDIAGLLNKNMGKLLPQITLTKTSTGARSSTSPSAGPTVSESNSPGRGILDSYRDNQYDDTIIKRGDRKVMILGDSLPSGVVPEPNDKITAEGREFVIVGVDRDPDAATYTCQVRGS